MKRLAGVAAVVCFGAIPTVLAEQRTEVIKNIPDVVVGAMIGSCGEFDILSDLAAVRQLRLHYNRDGVLVREAFQYRVIGQSRYYNSVDTGIAVLGGPGEVNPGSFDFVNNTLVGSGDAFKIKLPGYGVILHETGRTTIDLTTGTVQRDTGHNQVSEQDLAALCEALTP